MKLNRCLATFLVLSALVPGIALADPTDADKATARTLAIEGNDALAKMDYAGAADRFKRADALFHAPTLTLGLARAQVGLGKLLGAQKSYRRTAHEDVPPNASAALKKAVQDAQKELDALAPHIPGIILDVKGAHGLKVTMDGVFVPLAALGVKWPADPGEHVIHAAALGFSDRELKVMLVEGKDETVVIEFERPQAAVKAVPSPVASPPISLSSPTTLVAPAISPSAPPDEPPSSTQRKIGIVVGAAGLVSLGVGAAFGGIAISKNAASEDGGHCKAQICDAVGKPLNLDSIHAANISTGGFVAGGILLAAGVVVFVTSPAHASSASVAVGPGNVAIVGRW